MSTPLAVPFINGVRHSVSSIELKMAGRIFIGFKSINYSRTRTRGWARGAHPDPLGKTQGENEYSADCELYFAEFMDFLRSIAGSDDISGYGDMPFTVLVTYRAKGFDVVTDEILGCTLDSTEASNGQGPDPTLRKAELNPVKILFAGKDDVEVPLAPPAGS